MEDSLEHKASSAPRAPVVCLVDSLAMSAEGTRADWRDNAAEGEG